MHQNIAQSHQVNAEGNPTGGVSTGTGIDIRWQDGPLGEQGLALGEPPARVVEPNGAFVDGVVSAAIGRLQFYQSSKFRCRENALAITKLEEAMHWLDHRTRSREMLGVEGTHGLRDEEG